MNSLTEIIIRGRQEGKTRKLIELSAVEGGYIVVHSRDEAGRVARLADEMELKIPFPITYHEFIHKQYNANGVKQVYIDNVEILLQQMSKVFVRAITMSNNDPDGPRMESRNGKN